MVHVGDFTLGNKEFAASIIKQLRGTHLFLQGSHDRWLSKGVFLWEHKFGDRYVVCCHYPMRSWPRSHYGSWQLYGHVHGRGGKHRGQLDIGVDTTGDYAPVSWEEVQRQIFE